jgi:hypothetical protein
MKIHKLLALWSVAAIITLAACKKDDNNDADPKAKEYIYAGVEASTKTDVLVPVTSLTSGTISPIGNGIEQKAWMTYVTNGNTLVTSGYAASNELTGYRVKGGKLTNIGSMITELQTYVYGYADDNTMLALGVTRAGYEERIIYKINTSDMSIISRTRTRIDERKSEGLVAWPTSLQVRDNKVFVSYYLMGSGADSVKAFATPNSNEARVAVYSYPDLNFEKIIKDSRTSDIGCYSSVSAVMETENKDLYTFSTSSLASGFSPTPTKPSGFLKIASGSTEFDQSYFFNFEEASGGYKINNAVYAGNGKVVVRMVKDDTKLWGTYSPVTATPICYIGIADLNSKTVSLVGSIPAHGGEWGMANLVKGGKVYVNISDNTGAHIYEIDPATATAVKGAKLEGNWVKSIHLLTE